MFQAMISDNDINGVNYAYINWYGYLELEFIQTNNEIYCSNIRYS